MTTPYKFTEERRAVFLAAIERHGETTAACAEAGVSRSCAYDTARKDPIFAAACEAAQGRLHARMMSRVEHLALDGVEKTTYDKDGNKVAVTRVYSERLLLAWLKRQKREDWGDQMKVEKTVTTVDQTPVQALTADARKALRIALQAMPSQETPE